MADPPGRVNIAFGQPTLLYDCTWTRIDDHPNLVTSYSIDRGRQYELDRTDVGRATVTVTDPDGILDPTNPDGPYYGKIEPLLQAMIRRRNPVTGSWDTRFRGFIEEMDYQFDPSQKFNRLTLTLIDIFEILNAVKMFPSSAGYPADAPPESAGQVWFQAENMDDRIFKVIGDAQIPAELIVCFSGNVVVADAVYSPGESAMTAVQEAADAEFPGVSNVYTDRFGRLAVHGRVAKFDPAGVHSTATAGAWDWHIWHAGDGAAVHAGPASTAHIRRFATNRGLAKVINQALATPAGIADEDVDGQTVSDITSIGKYGIRAQEWQNLLTLRSLLDGADALVETKRFAEYYVTNYRDPQNRVTECAFRSMRPAQEGAAANWLLLQQVDISDLVHITVGSPGGGGLEDAQFYVEGVHETCSPLNPDYDNVDLSLDLSPVQYFADVTMWPS